MKKVIVVSLFFALTLTYSLMAQTGVNFGIKAGYNIATQYGIKPPNLPYEVNSESRNGFSGGVFFYFPITESFGVQQEFLYSTKGSKQGIIMTQPPMSTTTEYNIDYFELPITFRYNFVNIGNLGIYGSSGFALSMLVNGDYLVNGSINMGGVDIPIEESGNMDGLDQFDYSFVYGLGLKFKLLDQNCFFDFRQTIGWNTLMMPTSEGGEPAPLRNQTYAFSLGVYF